MPTIVAIVGRPNVGKSTLFNRIVGQRRAIVHDRPGVTRDRLYGSFVHAGRPFVVMDTGGYEPSEPGVSLLAAMRTQVEAAIAEADVLLLVLDRTTGLLPADEEVVALLRATEKPLLVGVNKVDEPRHENDLADFWSLGFDRLFAVSAEHGRGIGDLLDAVAEVASTPIDALEPEDFPDDDGEGLAVESEEGDADTDLDESESQEASGVGPPEIRIAILGRPNVGKSTLANRLVGEDRHLVHDAPGTTMDAVDSVFEAMGHRFRLVDTAGIRRRARIDDRLESVAVSLAIRSIERCHLSLLLVDAVEGASVQDARLAHLVADRGRALVFLVNRWDLVRDRPDRTARILEDEIRTAIPHATWAPILYTSARTGKGCQRIVPVVLKAWSGFARRIPTPDLNRFLGRLEATQPPPQRFHHPVRLLYLAQTRVRPPTFALVSNTPEGIPDAYRRFLERRIRETWDFEGTPIRIHVRRRRKIGAPR
ncbi:MAG: ribosome biogenesis GTPase Der [Deltaproteobacteria bacterium]|nr:ribosome biogenesis GTPase Der [Deltaproteobacteria bacterium]